MKLLLFVLLTLAGAVAAALWIMEDPGYVLISAGPWTVETSLVIGAVIAVLAFFAAYFIVRLAILAFGLPGGLRLWSKNQRERKAQHALAEGLTALAEGDWRNAERSAVKFANGSRSPLLNYLTAARAAQEQGAEDRRDQYLTLAYQHAPEAKIAVGLTQAELQLRHHQREQALASLRHLQQMAPKHPRVLSALASLYRELEDWENFLELLPILRKRRVLPEQELDQMARQAYVAQLTSDGRDAREIWSRIPKTFQGDAEVLTVYVEQLMKQGDSDLAEPLLRHALKRQRNDCLMLLYSKVDCADPCGQLAHAESWLAGHKQDSVNLLTAGRLALRCKLWGKARGYLEASVSIRPSAEAYNELGNLLEQLGEQKAALENYRRGLRLIPSCAKPVPVRGAEAEKTALPWVAS
jgi:HemY protein